MAASWLGPSCAVCMTRSSSAGVMGGSMNGSRSRPWSGNSMGVRTLRALSLCEALKRLRWMTRKSGARVIVIFFLASRSTLQRGQRQMSSP